MRNHVPLRPPHRQATSSAYLGLEGSNPCFLCLLAIFLLLMPIPLHRTIAPRPWLVPDRRPHICGPVPHFGCNSLHADSHHSSLTIPPCVPMSYEAQRL